MKLETILLEQELHSIFVENSILVESSLSDLNRVLTSKDNVAIFLAGAPRTGKSTIINKYIKPKARNVAVVAVDDISKQFTGDTNIYHRGSTALASKRFGHIVGDKRKDRIVVVYDVTGSSYMKYRSVINTSKKNGFKIVFLHAFSPLETTVKRNEKTSRKVELDYLKRSWEESQGRIKKFWNLFEPDLYLIMYNSDNISAWYRYNGNKITK